MRSVSVGRSPAITSSSSNSRGSVASARATSTRLRSDSVNVAASWCRRSNKSRRRSSACARSRAAPTSRRRNRAPTTTLSSTLNAGNGRTSWKVRAMPRRHIASGGKPPIGSPAKVIVPSSGVIAPAIILNNVVLPAPFGPITANSAPSGTSKLTLSTATRPRKRLLTLTSESSAVIAGSPPRRAVAPARARCRRAAPRSRTGGKTRRTPARRRADRRRMRPARR